MCIRDSKTPVRRSGCYLVKVRKIYIIAEMEEMKEGMKDTSSPHNGSEDSKKIAAESHESTSLASLEDSSSERLNPYMTSSSQSQSEDEMPPQRVSKSRSRSRSRSHSYKKGPPRPSRYRGSRRERRSARTETEERRASIVRPGLDGPLLSYKHFMDLQRGHIDPEEAEQCYNKYKRDHVQKQNDIFFHMHKVVATDCIERQLVSGEVPSRAELRMEDRTANAGTDRRQKLRRPTQEGSVR
eukprot:TRINITY_DN2045_c0_g5_i1.p1 TRINITY_DN2045_c0_g5~~TRINITY_DN2045_c0_g5_i1.p1  ORF type:complete len:241 (-),score=5.86 TRINITY_DN2045_c0_g5_i1:134-856(-)